MSNPEEQIKAKLGIKYSAAKQLIAEAKTNLEIADDGADRLDEILDEATQIFEDDLLPDEQEEMRVSGQVQSDFKQRAMAAAQRREAAAAAAAAEPVVVKPEAVEEPQPIVTEEPAAEEVEIEQEVIEETVEQDGEYEEGAGGETVTHTVTEEVAEDGTKTIRTKTVKKTITEETGGTKVAVCCVIL